MKIYIIADMEGIAGVVSPDQISGNSWEYDLARKQFNAEVCAVCSGAIEGGAEEIYVNDFHGNGRNLDPVLLPQQVMLVRGEFRPCSGFDHLDNTFAGLILLGAHARSGSRDAVIPHTYNPDIRFELYGQPVGEFDLLALLAGEMKVPTLLISGDAKTIEQAHTNLPATATVITKFGLTGQSAVCLHPKAICEMLREETKRAMQAASTLEPPMISPPVQLLVKLTNVSTAERLDWIPGLKRVDELTYEFMGETMVEVMKLVYGVTTLVSAKF